MVNKDALVQWLLLKGFAEERAGYGHVSAEELAEELVQKFVIEWREPAERPNLTDKRRELGDRDYVYWCLAGSFTAQGRENWWDRRRSELNGRTPREAWEDYPETVIYLAERNL